MWILGLKGLMTDGLTAISRGFPGGQTTRGRALI